MIFVIERDMNYTKKLIRFIEEKFAEELREKIVLEEVFPQLEEFPQKLSPQLKQILEEDGIQKLFTHQVEAFESVTSGKDTLLVSRTASGKTLSFLLPILDDFIKSKKKFTTLLLYPTKALSRDQESTLGKLLSVSPNVKFGVFDGDTSREERDNLTQNASFILSNPDMLHSGILPNHTRKWRAFLKSLKYIVIDEVHTYRGAFGSHFANVIRRLLRICETLDNKPIFVCSSATIGNPLEHSRALLQRDFHIIDRDGSPRAKKHVLFLNPKLYKNVEGSYSRLGTSYISSPVLRFAMEEKIRSISFCRARQEVERLYTDVTRKHDHLKEKIKPYRGGLLPSERRSLEKDLFNGKIYGIISTNALELGIDIGDMTLCILNGHPGSISSFWQQAGRVGRKGNESVILFIAKDSPIDQHIIHNPDYILKTNSEEAWLSADNPYILLQHLPCAAYEHPLRNEENYFQSKNYKLAIRTLCESEILKPFKEVYRYAKEEYPSKGVNLRGLTDYNVIIKHNGEVIGEIDPIGAMGTLYKDAIYQHLGKRYMSVNLDLEKKICEVKEENVDYYTEAVWESSVKLLESDTKRESFGNIYEFGLMHVTKQPKMYKKIREKKRENIGYGPITLPPFEYETMGFYILPALEWTAFIQMKETEYSKVALDGLGFILKNLAPSFCMGDVADIHTDVQMAELNPTSWKYALYLYDAVEGGVGFSEKIFERLSEVLEFAEKVIDECECQFGCPACVVPKPIQTREGEKEIIIYSNASVETTKSLIRYLVAGEFYEPQIVVFESFEHDLKVQQAYETEEFLKELDKLKRAQKILEKKRNRIY